MHRSTFALVTAAVALPVLACACGPIGSTGAAVDDSGTTTHPDTATPPFDSTPGDAPPSDGSHPVAPNGYYVDGNQVFTAGGVPHVFHGVARPSLEWNASGDHLAKSDYTLMAGWKANVVRLALNQDFWLSGSSAYAAGYAGVVDQNVHWIEELGMDVILDLHWSDRGNLSGTPGQQRMADANSITFWTEIAAKYAGDGHVMFELYNEPHDVTWDVWRNGGPSGDGFQVAGMQQLHDAVRATGAKNIVIVGGLKFAYDLSGAQSYHLDGFNVMYATHPYNQPDKQPADWDKSIGSLAAVAPVIVTEFGDATGCSSTYADQVIQYSNLHALHWTAWAWFVGGCGFPSLITDWSATPSGPGGVVKSALAAY